jgi:hypothetical protein
MNSSDRVGKSRIAIPSGKISLLSQTPIPRCSTSLDLLTRVLQNERFRSSRGFATRDLEPPTFLDSLPRTSELTRSLDLCHLSSRMDGFNPLVASPLATSKRLQFLWTLPPIPSDAHDFFGSPDTVLQNDLQIVSGNSRIAIPSGKISLLSQDLMVQIPRCFPTTLWTWKNQRSRCSHGVWGSTIQISSLFTKIEGKGLLALNALIYSLDSMIVNDRRLSDRVSSIDQYLTLRCYLGI